MELVLFLFLAGLTIYLSFKLSYYADILNKTSNISGVFIGGILLAGLTSLPEFVTCLSSIFLNNPYLAIGDILGSNFFNISIMCLFDILFIKTMFYNYTKNKYYIIYLLLIINYFIMYLFMGGIFNLELFNIGIPSFIIIISYIIYLKKAQEKDSKKEIIKTCIKNKIKFISSMGVGNKLNPSKLKIVDVRKTNYDPIAKIIRKMVKDEKINAKIPVVYSDEIPIKVKEKIGSTSFVPATCGLLCASYIINDIIKE